MVSTTRPSPSPSPSTDNAQRSSASQAVDGMSLSTSFSGNRDRVAGANDALNALEKLPPADRAWQASQFWGGLGPFQSDFAKVPGAADRLQKALSNPGDLAGWRKDKVSQASASLTDKVKDVQQLASIPALPPTTSPIVERPRLASELSPRAGAAQDIVDATKTRDTAGLRDALGRIPDEDVFGQKRSTVDKGLMTAEVVRRFPPAAVAGLSGEERASLYKQLNQASLDHDALDAGSRHMLGEDGGAAGRKTFNDARNAIDPDGALKKSASLVGGNPAMTAMRSLQAANSGKPLRDENAGRSGIVAPMSTSLKLDNGWSFSASNSGQGTTVTGPDGYSTTVNEPLLAELVRSRAPKTNVNY